MDDDTISFIIALIIALFVIGAIIFGALTPYFEAKSFNECTGGHATYWTALFTELRVQDCK